MIGPMQTLSSAGPWIYPLGALALCLLLSIGRALVVIRSDDPLPPAGPPHHTVLVWGALGLVVGLAGMLVGLGRLAAGIRAVLRSEGTEVEAVADMMMPGLVVVAAPATLGLVVLATALVAWLGLGFLLNRRGR